MKVNGNLLVEGEVTCLETLEGDPCCANVAAYHVAVTQDDDAFCGILVEGDRNDIKLVMDVPALCALLDVVMDAHKTYGIPLSMAELRQFREPSEPAPKAKPRSDN